MSFFTKIFGDPNEREINKLRKIVERINTLEKDFEHVSNEELKGKTSQLKNKIKPTGSPPRLRHSHGAGGGFGGRDDFVGLDEILPEAFTIVREAAKRTLGQRHFDVQAMGGIALNQGKIAEMKTGEGKTLASTMPVYFNALKGEGVHIVTVNDYLAKRDAVWMGQIYNALGLSTACITHDAAFIYDPSYEQNSPEDETRDELGSFKVEDSYLRPCARKEAYAADITYGTNNEFGFDYLRDNLAQSADDVVQRGQHFAIIDEVDSILIDEARTPLIISAPDEESTTLYKTFSSVVPRLKENEDYNVDEKMKAATITEEGVAKLEKVLGIENIYDPEKGGGIRYVHQLEQALRARVLFQKDKDYVVKDGEVVIVDEFTGRLMPGRRYSEGLHQALEAKEGLSVQRESRTLASITFQNYFRMYDKLAGMTGTALTSAEEFDRVYGLDVVVIPTNKPMIREDYSDSIFRTRPGKFRAVVEEVKKRNAAGQPVLVGTTSIENNETVSLYLKKAGIEHEILNAKNHEREGAIIAQAGRFGAVTVATNMAGRGVDIILGGNPPDSEEARKVSEVGGLFVLGTERHEARRIDNQLRGRSGRQGDPGGSQFFVSLEDDLMRVFGGDRIKGLMKTLKIPEDQPIASGLVSGAIESAQGKIEGYHFDARKHVLDYDEVLNKQRQMVYERRKEVLSANSKQQTANGRQPSAVSGRLTDMIEYELRKMVDFHTAASHPADWNIEEISENVRSIIPAGAELHSRLSAIRKKSGDPEVLREEIRVFVLESAKSAYKEKEKNVGEEKMRELEKFIMLRTLDMLWMEHLETMESLRDSVRLRAYGQKDPLVEYKREGREMFSRLLDTFQMQVVHTIFKVEFRETSQAKKVEGVETRPGIDSESKKVGYSTVPDKKAGTVPASAAKIGRNAPCPCGSGKKYKKCCGK